MNWPWRRWLERRRHAHGLYAPLFEPYRGDAWVALDLETTGLDAARDEILAVAAVPGEGRCLRLRDRLDLLVHSESPRITTEIRHHRLRPCELANGVSIDEALQRLLGLIGNRPLVGYCIGFDMAVLNRAVRARLGFGLPNRCIDVQREYAAWQQRIRPQGALNLRFEAIAAALGLPMPDRHRALGDAVTAGLMHISLQQARTAPGRRTPLRLPPGGVTRA